MIELSARYVKKHSEKKNKDYYCIEIPITESYTKVVFLNDLENSVIQSTYADEF